MKLPSFDNIFQAIRNSVSRFPMAILLAVLTSTLLMYLVENEPSSVENIYFRIMVSLAIGFPLMIGLQIASEQYLDRPFLRWLYYLAGIIFVLIYFYFLSPDFTIHEIIRPVRFISFFVIVHLFVSVAPFVKGGNVNDFWEYNKTIFVQWFIGAFYAAIIYAGLAIAVLAVDQLFDVKVNYKLYAHLFIVVAAIFHPFYFTNNFPKVIHGESIGNDDSKGIKNLVLFILIPLSMLYFSILYLYGLKILISWNLPKGWVSSLVIGFSVAGTLCYLLNYRLADIIDNSILRWFKKWFFYILAPLVILLYIAIIKRINDYGFTPERYFVLLTGIWLTILSGYFIISSRDNIKWIPTSLIIFLFIGTISPIDAFRVSAYSQMNRLRLFLKDKSALKDNKIAPDPKNFNYEDVYKLTSMIQLLEELNAIDNVNRMLLKPISEYDAGGITTKNIVKNIGLETVNETSSNKYLNYNAEPNQRIPLQGYKLMIPVNIYKGGIYENGVQLNKTNDSLFFKENTKVIDAISLKKMMVDLESKYGKRKENLKPEESSFLFSSRLYKSKLVLTQLSIEKLNDNYEVSSLTGYLLLNNK